MNPIIKPEELTEDQRDQLKEYFKIYNDVLKTGPEQYLEYQKGAVQALIHVFGDDLFKEKQERLKVKNYDMTCHACPSQWDIFLEDEGYVYARYRWGRLSLTKDDDCIFYKQIGGDLDGMMSTEELMELTKDILDWDEIRD